MKTQTSRQFLRSLTTRRRVRALHLAITAACLFAGGAATSLRAADGTWITDGNGAWGDSTNWSGGVIADGAGSTANFAYGITANRTVTNDTPRTIGNLFFDDTGTGATVDTSGDSVWLLTGTAANPLTFSGGGGTSTITANSTVGYGNEFAISAVLAGSNNLVFNSTQTLNASAQRYLQVSNVANTYTGTTTVSNGFLDVGANSILAAGSPLGISTTAIVVGNANTVVNTAGGGAPTTGLQIFANGTAGTNYTIDRNIDSSTTADVAGRTDIRFNNNSAGGAGTLTVSGNWALSAPGTANHSYGLDAQQPGQTINFTGNITGTTTAAFRVNDYGQGNGTIRLSGANTFAGQVLVEEGNVIVGNNAPSAGAGPLGANAAIQLGSGGVTSLNSANSNASIGIQTDGAYAVGKNVTLGSSAITSGGTANLQQAYSWTLGGSSGTASSFTGAINSPNVTFSRTLNLTQVANGTTTFSGIVGANADANNVTTVEKTGAGVVILTNANTYDGGTRITAGTLLVNGGVAGTSSGSGTGTVSVGVVSAAQNGVSGSIANSGTGTFVTRQINNISTTVAAGLQVGQSVTGTGIAAGAVIQSIGVTSGGTASIVISTPITVAANTGNTYTDLAFGALTTTGTLGGSGILNASLAGSLVTVNTGSILAPGGAVGTPGILSVVATQTAQPTAADGTASLNLLSGSTLAIKLNGTVAGTGYDQVAVTGTVALGGGALTLTLNGLATALNQRFVIVNNDGTDTVFGTFGGQAENSTISVAGGTQFRINYNAVGGTDGVANDVVLTVVAVPEPGTWAMLGLGFGVIGLFGYRRMSSAKATV